ncbi:hypothetical protein [Marisediminicola senii]|uniref:hypothetical protein n=1 Tax=Marisediminicola senii TaxID=2711233 RepID=UPI0013EBCF0E|nr:hypothetical protein [Marisediminicola senii]
MELFFVAVIAVVLGVVARYITPGRHTHGAALVPAIGVAAAALVWTVLTWVGMPFDGGWIWVITIAVAVAAPLVAARMLPGRRAAADERLHEKLLGSTPRVAY